MKQLKHLRQTLWRALLCLTVVVGFASPGWAKTVYWDNTGANWGSVYAYLYDGGDAKTVGPLSAGSIDSKTLYSVDASGYNYVIFKPNQDTWDNQTSNLPATDGYVYNNTNVNNNTKPCGKVVDGTFVSPLGGSTLYIGVGASAENNGGSRASLVEDVFFKGYTFDVTDSQKFMFYNAASNGSWFGADGSVQTVTTDGTEYLAKGHSTTKAYQINGTGQYKLNVTSYNGSEVKFNVTKIGGDVTTTDYDIYLKRSRDWNNPELLTFTDGKCTLTRNMNASGQFGIQVCTKGTMTEITNGYYAAAKGSSTVAAGTKTYTLYNSNFENFTLPNKGGEYTFVITLNENGLPKDITITTPEIEEVKPDLYLGGNWISGCGTDIDKNLVKISENNGVYAPYTFKVSTTDKMFRFYTKTSPTKNSDWMGPNGNKTLSDAEIKGTELSATTSYNVFKLPKAGTYTINVKEYNATAKTVKFTITWTEPEKHLYLGASFKGNIEDPNFQLDYGKTFTKVRFTKNSNDGDVMFRFAKAFDRAGWIGPSNDESISLSASNTTGTYTTSSSKSEKVYKVLTNGVYELEVTSWNDFEVKFKLTYIEAVDESTPYYFVGDMNDWFSLEFEDPNAAQGANMPKFMAERDTWKFRKVTDKDLESAPSEVNSDWYVFDGFPGKQLSGQFQISSGGKHIWNDKDSNITGTEVYGHEANLNKDNMWTNSDAALKSYLSKPISDGMIKESESFSKHDYSIRKRTDYDSSFANFHMECNAVDNAKIYFKPGDNADMIISGDPRHFFVFYANKKTDDGDDIITAKINSGKPNTNNYFLPGIKYGDGTIQNYVDLNGNKNPHMNIGEGVQLVKVEKFKNNDYNSSEIMACLKGLGIDDVDARSIAEEGKLPNGRLVSGFDHLYVARIPAGFENPAGWKYNLSLPKSLSSDDRNKSVTVACNHIYFMPTINGVSVHVSDENFKNSDFYVEDPESGVKVPVSDFDIQYYYRIYYSKPTDDGQNYQIVIAEHQPGNIISEEHTAYVSGTDARKPTLEETGRNRDFGWKPLNAYTNPDFVNTISGFDKNPENWAEGQSGWNINEGNTSGITDPSKNWHICWVQSDNMMRRQRIPKEMSNAYVQILAIFYKKDNANNPMRSKAARAESNGVETVEAADVADAIKNADHLSIEPGELSFDNDIYHHPLQGNHLYYVLDGTHYVWTGVEKVEDDSFDQTLDSDVNAAPVYYNLQGVRVAEPTKGIYIEVRGNKSRKVAF